MPQYPVFFIRVLQLAYAGFSKLTLGVIQVWKTHREIQKTIKSIWKPWPWGRPSETHLKHSVIQEVSVPLCRCFSSMSPSLSASRCFCAAALTHRCVTVVWAVIVAVLGVGRPEVFSCRWRRSSNDPTKFHEQSDSDGLLLSFLLKDKIISVQYVSMWCFF